MCFVPLSCIENDIPMPYQPAAITALEAEGALSVNLDEKTRCVTLEMDEICDLSAVVIKSVSFNYPNTKSSIELTGTFDLRNPLSFVLSTYQDYKWKIRATQSISREFSVRGQIGAAIIDEASRRIFLKVSKATPLTRVELRSIKLGPRDISSYSIQAADVADLSGAAEIIVRYRDVVEVWTVYAEQSELSVEFGQISPHTRRCWVSANAPDEKRNGFLYRMKHTQDWIEVETEGSEGSVIACLEDLEPLTTYECLAFSDEEQTEIMEFTTGAETQIPNSDFEVFAHDESPNYFSWYNLSAGQIKWWDSGNIGSTMVGASYCISIPDTEDFVSGAASAKLVSRNVIVKFAAGNIFSGSFGQLMGTAGATVNFGRPFTERPRSVKLWVKYDCGIIDCFGGAPEGDDARIGARDKSQVYIALGDWDYREYGGIPESPLCINTTDKDTFFNPDGPGVIAYGAFIANEDIKEWMEVEIPLEYRDNFRVPTHIIVSAAASRLGDWFTGSSSSVLHLDDLRLIY